MSILRRLAGSFVNLVTRNVPGPPVTNLPPDIDGRRDSADMDYERAVLEAQLSAKGSAAMSGTIVSGPRHEFGPPRNAR
jgi:hypothetical protein